MATKKFAPAPTASTTGDDGVPARASAAAPAGQQRPVSVRFDDTSVTYASQFIINATAEELIVGFSSGVMDSGDGRPAELPVHNRIAMTRPAAARLIRLLAKALRRTESAPASGNGNS